MQRCEGCKEANDLGFEFATAFQPIVDMKERTVWGYEALVRGPNGEGAASVLRQVNAENKYWFDQACRVKAIETAVDVLPLGTRLSINFMPNAVYEPRACIRKTMETTERVGFDPKRLMFEFTEDEKVTDHAHLRNIIDTYRSLGFLTALDDFGAGHAGLGLLARLQPDLLKIDMDLIRNVDTSRARQAIVRAIAQMASELGLMILAEGVETEAEMNWLGGLGVTLFQGYALARPKLGAPPEICWPQSATSMASL